MLASGQTNERDILAISGRGMMDEALAQPVRAT